MRKMTFIVGYWPRRTRHTRWRSRLSVLLLVLAGFFCFLIADQWVPFFSTGIEAYIGQLSRSDNLLKSVLQQGLPLLELEDAEYMPPINIAASLLSAVTTVNLDNPKGLLESQFSYMEKMDIEAVSVPYSDTGSEQGSSEVPDSQLAPENNTDQASEETPGKGDTDSAATEAGEAGAGTAGDSNPLVGLYNTHNTEKYAGEVKKVTTSSEAESAGVVRVAEVLENTLRDKYRIAAARSKQIHDYPDWNLSYTKSKETGKSLLSKNPSIQVLLDIHRDAGIKEKHSVVINGRQVAKVLIIVGSAQRLDNPNWEKNKEFADKVEAKMEELYPGLSRGVRVQTGRYNQHLHPHAILLEMGNAKNSLAEAEGSAELMAHVISEVLKDISANKL